MSSSPPTEAPRTRWRDPKSWPLRARLVALMIGLLLLLGLVVGGTAELYLHNSLYTQLDQRLSDLTQRVRGPGGDGFHGGGGPRGYAPPGAQVGEIFVRFTSGATPTGGIIQLATSDEGQYVNVLTTLSDDTAQRLQARIVPNGRSMDIDLGGALGDYRVVATQQPDASVTVAAIPLEDTNETLMKVALVTGGGVLFAVIIAGLAGVVIIRRTLRPLDRVAATATRVSELELDRGEVDLAQRVPEAYTDVRTEVGQVGAALNRMLDHVGNALEARHASETQVRQFVADASHELRTPLAAIRGYAELSRRSRQPVPDEIGHVLDRVESEAKRMTLLVEDLLLLARLDAGRPLAHDPVDLTMLVVDAVSDAHAAGPRHHWQLDLPEEPVTVVGDGARLHQVLANLLANARTHTPEGTSVTVSVSATGDAAVLTVTDEGPGIPAELQPHIFERFARGDSSRSRAAGSTGLGLSIVSAVVSAHGGSVSVQSAPGKTVFTVLLPLRAEPVVTPFVQVAPPAG
nr:HAMP domain-containing sensor histidine kinase [uncultured Actinoplanes sp.]